MHAIVACHHSLLFYIDAFSSSSSFSGWADFSISLYTCSGVIYGFSGTEILVDL